MEIYFEANWDDVGAEGYPNHDSSRSQEEVVRLVQSVILDAKESGLATWMQIGQDVYVEKGIHQRRDATRDHRAHIRVRCAQTRYHINLISSEHAGGSFVWKVEGVADAIEAGV